MSLQDVSDALGMSVSHLSRVENGIRSPHPDDVGSLLGFFQVRSPRRDDLLALVREGQDYNWWQVVDGSFSVIEDFMSFEREAVSLRTYEPNIIPGLLQIPEYTRAVALASNDSFDEDTLEKIVGYRMQRQQSCRRPDGPMLHALVDETACRRPIGGPAVTSRQLRAVVQAASDPNVTVQLVPLTAGAHPGIEGPFMLMNLGSGGELLYTEDRCAAAFIEDRGHIEAAKQAFQRLCTLACSPDDSRRLIVSIADELACDSGGADRQRGTSQLAQELSQ